MAIYFSRHARRQMKWRKLSEGEALAALSRPDSEEKSIGDRINAYKVLDDRQLKVTYRRQASDIIVITVIEKER